MGKFRFFAAAAVCSAVYFLGGCSETAKNSGNEVSPPAEGSEKTSPDLYREENDDLYKLEFFGFSVGDELTEPDSFKLAEDIISYTFNDESSSVDFYVNDSVCFRTPELCIENEIDTLSAISDSISRTDTEINGFQCTELKYDISPPTKRFVMYLHCEGNHIKIETTYMEDDEQRALKFAREIADSVVYLSDYHITDEDKHFVSDSYEAVYSSKWRLFTSGRKASPDLEFVYAMAEDNEHHDTNVSVNNDTEYFSSFEELDKKVSENIKKKDVKDPEVAEEFFMGANAKTYSYEYNDVINKCYLFELNGELYFVQADYNKNCPDAKEDIDELMQNIKIK